MRTVMRLFYLLIVACMCSILLTCHPDRLPGSFYPAVAFDELNRRYLAVFVKVSGGQSRISGVFIDSDGGPLGGEFVVAAAGGQFFCPSLVYDNIHSKFLVVWNAETSIYAQSINTDGTPNGPRLSLSDTAEPPSGRCSALAFDHVQGAFLAAWGEKNPSDHDSLYARLITADGSLAGPKVLISNDGATPAWPSVAYDSANQRYLAVWDNAGNHEIKGSIIRPDGSVDTPEFSIHSVGGVEYRPKAVYDSFNARFMVTWEHSDTPAGKFALLGQMWNADGTSNQPVFTISAAGLDVLRHAAVFDPVRKQYLILFGDFNQDIQRIHSQIVLADGASGTVAVNNDVLLSDADYAGDRRPAVAYDSVNQRYFSAWSYGSGDQQFSDIHGRHVNSDGTPSGQIYVLSNGGIWP